MIFLIGITKVDFLFDLSQEINKHVINRAVRRRNASEAEFQDELKIIINDSSEYILEFTRELEILSNRGFSHKK